ncbi:MAG: hypothetical protein G5Z42_00245 [Caldisphaeraceae archaeon]|nr:hypothetical protein [Caldisphaeraceae archaeon]MEB3692057.1 hypothetical protein [Caldisphaeraceae archaeon]MEB3797234.1 hypothetical protein [Caldisphaeraceae archaeon]
MKLKILSLMVIVLVSAFMFSSITIAQTSSPLKVKVSNTTVTISTQYYSLVLNLSRGASVASWIAYSPTGPVEIVRNGSQIPSMVLSINESFPGNLYTTQWKAIILNKSKDYAKIMLMPISYNNDIYIKEYIEVSSFYPFIEYSISIATNKTSSLIKNLYFGVGANTPNATWSFVDNYISNNSLIYSIYNKNVTSKGVIKKMCAIGFGSKGIKDIIGVSFPVPINIEYKFAEIPAKNTSKIAGKSYVVFAIQNIELHRGEDYNISFKLYGIPFNPEIISLVNAVGMVSQVYPSINKNITELLNYQSYIKSYIAKLTSLNSSVNNLTNKVSELQALISYWKLRYSMASTLNSKYLAKIHKNGEILIGLFILGIVIGVLGGAFLLRPKPIEARVVRSGRKKEKKK